MLASLNDGAAKSAIIDFAARVTREGGLKYFASSECIATFANASDDRSRAEILNVRGSA